MPQNCKESTEENSNPSLAQSNPTQLNSVPLSPVQLNSAHLAIVADVVVVVLLLLLLTQVSSLSLPADFTLKCAYFFNTRISHRPAEIAAC